MHKMMYYPPLTNTEPLPNIILCTSKSLMTLYDNVPGLSGVLLCSGVEPVRGVAVDRRGVAGTMQLGYRRWREREWGGESEKERSYHLSYKIISWWCTLLCMHSTALSSSLISSLLTVTSDLACSNCLWDSSSLLSLASCNHRGYYNDLYTLGMYIHVHAIHIMQHNCNNSILSIDAFILQKM